MSRNLTIPPNFVTLRHLKELKEKREEEERNRKLKEEEEERERLRKLDEEDHLRKLKKEEEEGSLKNPPPKTLESKGPYRQKLKERGSRWGANPEARPSRGGWPGACTNLEAPAPENGGLRRGPSANPDARSSRGGRPKAGPNLETQAPANEGSGRRPSANPDEGLNSGTNLEASAAANGKSELEENFRKKKEKREKRRNMIRECKMTKMPLAPNGLEEERKGLGAPTNEREEKTIEVMADTNGLGAPASENKSTKGALEVSRSERKKISSGVSYRPAKVIGSESGPVMTDIEKRVSDLKMGRRNPIPSWGRRPYRAAPSGRGGGGSGGVMMWVKKTRTEA